MQAGQPIRPRLSLLDQEGRTRVHEAALKILESVGIEVHADWARRKMIEAGAYERGGRLCLTQDTVAWALSVAPREIEVFDRNGIEAFTLSGIAEHPTRFGLGATNLYYEEPETSQIVPFERKHLALGSRLANALKWCDVVSTIGTPQDVPQDSQDLVAALEMAASTTKPLVVLATDERRFDVVLDLLDLVCSLGRDRPCALIYLNPSTPLAFHPATLVKLQASIERGFPVIFSNYGMSGATTPLDPYGTLVLLNAELLAGLVLSQVLREGASVVLGSLPAAFDMRGAGSKYTPGSFLCNLGCIEMMRHYGLPHCGTSGCGAGWGADLAAAGNLWSSHFTSLVGGGGLAPFVGGSFDSMVFSPLLAVYSDWVIGECRALGDGISAEHSSGTDEILEAVHSPEGFLTSHNTLEHHRAFACEDPMWPALSLDQWRQRGEPKAFDYLRDRTIALLESAPAPDDREEVLRRGNELLERFRHS